MGGKKVYISTKCATSQDEAGRTTQAPRRDKPAAVWDKADAPYICAAPVMNCRPQKHSLHMPAHWIMACPSGWLSPLAGRETA